MRRREPVEPDGRYDELEHVVNATVVAQKRQRHAAAYGEGDISRVKRYSSLQTKRNFVRRRSRDTHDAPRTYRPVSRRRTASHR